MGRLIVATPRVAPVGPAAARWQTERMTSSPAPSKPFTLLLLPGLACDAALFRHQLPVLQAKGFAPQVSDVHTRCDSLAAMATTLLAEHSGALVLAGCSMGGMLALEVARQAPQRVRGLALLGTSARADTPELIELRTQACELFAEGRMDEVLGANVAFAFHKSRAADKTLRADYLAMVQRAGAQQLIRQNRAVMTRADLRPSLGTITCPALVVCGQDDQLTVPAMSQEIAQALPYAQLHLLPQCGHMLSWEQPEALNTLLLDWLLGLHPGT